MSSLLTKESTSNFHTPVVAPSSVRFVFHSKKKWAMENHQKYHKLKTKQVSTQSILDGTAVLTFSGVVQVEEHSTSNCHQDALRFFTEEKPAMKAKVPPRKKTAKRTPKDIMGYFKAPLNYITRNLSHRSYFIQNTI